MEEDDLLETQFKKASDFLRKAEKLKLKDEQKLNFYKYFKQDSKTKEAWKSLNNMSKEDSMKKYVEELTKIFPSWNSNSNKAENLTNNNFEEQKGTSEGGGGGTGGPVFSREVFIQEKEEETICYFAKKGNLAKVKEILKSNKSTSIVNFKDEEGRSALILACDRGYLEIVKELIENGADINIQDEEGTTPLHVAATVGHVAIVKFLLEKGADRNIKDGDQMLPLDLCDDPEIKEMLESS